MGSSGFDHRNRIRTFELVVLPLPLWPPFTRSTSATLQALGGKAYGWRLFSFLSYSMRPQATSHFIPLSQSSQDARLFVWGACGVRIRKIPHEPNSTQCAVRASQDLPEADSHPAAPHTKSPRGRLGAISFYSSFSSGISTSIESIRSSLPSIRSAKPPHSGHITWKRSCVNS